MHLSETASTCVPSQMLSRSADVLGVLGRGGATGRLLGWLIRLETELQVDGGTFLPGLVSTSRSNTVTSCFCFC